MAKGFSVFVAIGAKLLPSLNSAAAGVEKRFSQMNRRLRIQAAETKVAFKEMQSALAPMAGLAAAGGLSMGVKGVFGEGAEFKHQIVLMQNMGRTSKEMAEALAAAHKTMRDVPTSSMNDSLKILNETTLAFGGLEHAVENLSFNSKMGALMKGIMGDGYDEAHGFNTLVRALELRGGKLSTKDYQRQAGELFKAISVSGGTVTPDDLLGFMQQAGPAARKYSEHFLTRVVPSLIQEFGGERAGTMATALNNQFNGRVAVGGKSIVEEWNRLGLINPGGLITKAAGKHHKRHGWKVLANGTVKEIGKSSVGDNASASGWKPGALKGYDLAMSDPLAYIEQVMMPAMRAKGIDTNNANAMSLEAQKLFGRETAKRLADTLFSPAQLARINADMKLYEKASGVDKAYSNALYNDPKMAQMAAANSLHNLETALGNSVWNNPTVTKAIIRLAEGVNKLADYFDGGGEKGKGHPYQALGLTGLMGGGALAGVMTLFGGGKLVGMLFRGLAKGLWTAFVWAVGGLVTRGGPLVLSILTRVFVGALVALAGLPVWATVLIVAAVVAAGAFIWHFRDQIWAKLVAAKDWFMKASWGDIGKAIAMAIADGLTFGLASRIPGIASSVKGWWGANMPTWAGGGPAVPAPVQTPKAASPAPALAPGAGILKPAGARASGGPVKAGHWYRINERGEEGFIPGRSGTIIPHSELQRRRAAKSGGGVTIGTINIHGANDPESTRRILRQELHRMAMGNAALLSD